MRFGFVIVVCVMLVVVLDGGEGAEEQAADVGENGGAARGDAAFGEEIVEDGEGVVDALRPLEIVSVAGEGDTKVFGVAGFGTRVRGAERAIGVGDQGTALAAGASAMLATLRSEIGAGRFWFHFDPRDGVNWGRGDPHPRCFCQRVRKALKRKDGRSEKSGKRVEECARSWRERR